MGIIQHFKDEEDYTSHVVRDEYDGSIIARTPLKEDEKSESVESNVTISKARLRELEEAELKLPALEGVGVDNWDGYDIAMEQYHELLEDLK